MDTVASPATSRARRIVIHIVKPKSCHENVRLMHVANHALGKTVSRAVNSCFRGWHRPVLGDSRIGRELLPSLPYSHRPLSAADHDRSHKRRDSSRNRRAISPAGHWCEEQHERVVRRVLVSVISGNRMRPPVPGPRLDCLISGRPGSSSTCSLPVLLLGRPISGNWVR